MNNHSIAILGYNNHELTLKNIDYLVERNNYDNIIFIDNGSSPSFEKSLEKYDGITYIRFDENIYVNPAWNYIFDTCPSRYVTLLNNDCFVLSKSYFKEVVKYMEKNDVVITSCKTYMPTTMPDALKIKNKHLFNSFLPLQAKVHARRQGWLMTIDLEQYKEKCDYKIPEGLKVWYGDDWIWAQIVEHNLKRAVFANRYALHLTFPVTRNSKIDSVIESDNVFLEKNKEWYEKMSPIIHCKSRKRGWYI